MMPFPSYYGSGRANGYWQMMNAHGGASAQSQTLSPAEKALAANKSHSEAERRRRERINGHLHTLRSLVPDMPKPDKASLLQAVVQRVKELKREAAEVSPFAGAGEYDGGGASEEDSIALMMPGELDKVTLEVDPGGTMIRATVCCEDRPDLHSDINGALKSLKMKAVRAEIATIGGRTKEVLHIRGTEVECTAVRRALKEVVDKGSRYVPKPMAVPGVSKRPRYSGSFIPTMADQIRV